MSDSGFLNSDFQSEQPSKVEVSVTPPEDLIIQSAEVLPGRPAVENLEVPSLEAEVSAVEADEQAYGALPETRDAFLEIPGEEEAVFEQAGSNTQAAAPATAGTVSSAQPVKDEVVLEVEKILEEGLGDYYSHMSEEARERFHQKGEETAFQIADMVRRFKVKLKKILLLIRQWLQTIPGVNRFFLEQEAKIKSDRVMRLAQTRGEALSSLSP